MPRKRAADKDRSSARKKPARPRKRRSLGAWRLPPLPWIWNAGRCGGEVAAPSRILCTGLPEAFLLAANLQEVDVIAIDPEAESVEAARRTATRHRLRNLRCEEAFLDQPALGELIGGNFDLVVAHDALHHTKDADAAFANLAAACAVDGTVYTSVRSISHPSSRLDAGLAAFGLKRAEIGGENEESENVAKMLAALGGFLPLNAPAFARELRGGGTGPAPLAAWLDRASAAGLHLRATTLTAKSLPGSLTAGGTAPLCSLSLSDLAILLDNFLAPASVELVFSRHAAPSVPWGRPEALRGWRPISRFLPLAKLPEMQEPWNGLAGIEVEIHGVLSPQNFTLSRYLVELIRRSDGSKSLAELMAGIPHEIDIAELVGALHFLHHAFILELQEP